jgi:hypothetical protein
LRRRENYRTVGIYDPRGDNVSGYRIAPYSITPARLEGFDTMTDATITIHLPAYRERALKLQTEIRDAEEAYDANIHDYIKYLAEEAAKMDFRLETDHGSIAAYSVHAPTHEAKKAARDWLNTLPDIWNWIP